jgi:hypothetical protein
MSIFVEIFTVVRITDNQGSWVCPMHTDRNSFCRGLASASSSDDVEPLKRPFVHSQASLLDAGRSSRRIGCLVGMAQYSFLLQPGVLPCSSSAAGKPSVVTGWRSRLAADLFSSHEQNCDWRVLVMLVFSGRAGCDVATSRSDVHLLQAYSWIMLACQRPVSLYSSR